MTIETADATGTEVPAWKVVGVINNTLNLVDPRLVNHGGRVAELTHRALETRGGLTAEARRDICLLAFLHDVGAYKTDEIDRLVHFETVRVWQHSIYGYLFIRNLKPMANLAPVVFFHHAICDEMHHVDASYRMLSQIFHVADRIDVMAESRGGLNREIFRRYFDRQAGAKFDADVIDLFDAALFDAGRPEPSRMYGPDAAADYCGDLFRQAFYHADELTGYLEMLVHSIDFRSPQTVSHTVGVAAIALELARLMNLDAETRRLIRFGAYLHDLGKQGIPQTILEADRRLTPEEMEVMRTHVKLSEDVLTGFVDPRIVRIAVRHHERMDGAGYHHGLSAGDLTVPERLVAVADVLSALLGVRSYKDAFPKEKVLAILASMKGPHLDPDIVDLAVENLDDIIAIMERVAAETYDLYDRTTQDYDRLLALSENFGKGSQFLLEGELAPEYR